MMGRRPTTSNGLKRYRARGIALVLVVTILGIATVLGAAILASASLQSEAKANSASAAEAQYLAESGVNVATYFLQNPQNAPVLNASEFYPGQSSITFGSSVNGSVDVSVTKVGPSLYDIQSTAAVGTSADRQILRSLNCGALVNSQFIVKQAAAFGGDFTVPDIMTITGGVVADGVLTKSSGATINGSIVASGSNVSGWIAKPTYPATHRAGDSVISTW